jgi:hypothetical protein
MRGGSTSLQSAVKLREATSRTIRAEWLKEALRTGKKVDITCAVIEGPLDLGYESITGEVSIKNSECLHNIDFF